MPRPTATDGPNLTADLVAKDLVAVERALSEIRAGRPMIVELGEASVLVWCVEAVDASLLAHLGTCPGAKARLVLAAPRLRRLGLARTTAGFVALPQLDLARIATLAYDPSALLDGPVADVTPLQTAALELLSLALVLPCALVVSDQSQSLATLRDWAPGALSVRVEALGTFRAHQSAPLQLIGRAPVPLEGAPHSEFVVFRGGEGLRDQVAVIVSKPDTTQPVTVRLHSACLTGDLFGSLKCDCGDQLRDTAAFMAENGGGVILYLDQEGRGNGLSNKIRAYQLQAHGFDTYDADEVLGFDHDQRHFLFAANMLTQLGISKVRVMTNNPLKLAALEEAGLTVVSDQRIQGRTNRHNVGYLATKRDRAGHMIDADIAPEP